MYTIGFLVLVLDSPFTSHSLKHVLIPFNFVKLRKLQIDNQIKVVVVFVCALDVQPTCSNMCIYDTCTMLHC